MGFRRIWLYDGKNNVQITTGIYSNFNNYNPKISHGRVVWAGFDSASWAWQIFLYDIASGQITQLTDGGLNYGSGLDANSVLWGDGNNQLVLYDLASATRGQISSGGYNYSPQINNGRVVWWEGSTGQVHLYDKAGGDRIVSTGGYNNQPQTDGSEVVWWGTVPGINYPEIFLYDIASHAITMVSNPLISNYSPQVSNGQVVWNGWDGNDYEIYLYNGHLPCGQLTNNNANDYFPKIDNGQVVWYGDDGNGYQIFLRDLTGTENIPLTSGSSNNWDPQINNGQIVWGGYDPGTQTNAIYLATPRSLDIIDGSDFSGGTEILERPAKALSGRNRCGWRSYRRSRPVALALASGFFRQCHFYAPRDRQSI